MNYTIHQLQIFLKVAEKQSITRASEELYMTQPAVSIQLKNFQDQFEMPLTEVICRRLFITDFGKEIALIADRVIQELETINYETAAYQGVMKGRLKISAASTGKYVIPHFLSGFLEANPGIDLTLDVTNKSKVTESLKANDIDLALVSVVPSGFDVEEEILIENKLFFIGNTPNRINGKPLIYREAGSATRTAMEEYFKSIQGYQRKQMELTSNEAVKQAVIAGLGYSLMPLIGIQNELLNKELFILDSPGLPVKTQWKLIWLRGKKLSPVSKEFLNFIRTEKENILNEKFGWYMNY